MFIKCALFGKTKNKNGFPVTRPCRGHIVRGVRKMSANIERTSNIEPKATNNSYEKYTLQKLLKRKTKLRNGKEE